MLDIKLKIVLFCLFVTWHVLVHRHEWIHPLLFFSDIQIFKHASLCDGFKSEYRRASSLSGGGGCTVSCAGLHVGLHGSTGSLWEAVHLHPVQRAAVVLWPLSLSQLSFHKAHIVTACSWVQGTLPLSSLAARGRAIDRGGVRKRWSSLRGDAWSLTGQ